MGKPIHSAASAAAPSQPSVRGVAGRTSAAIARTAIAASGTALGPLETAEAGHQQHQHATVAARPAAGTLPLPETSSDPSPGRLDRPRHPNRLPAGVYRRQQDGELANPGRHEQTEGQRARGDHRRTDDPPHAGCPLVRRFRRTSGCGSGRRGSPRRGAAAGSPARTWASSRTPCRRSGRGGNWRPAPRRWCGSAGRDREGRGCTGIPRRRAHPVRGPSLPAPPARRCAGRRPRFPPGLHSSGRC